MISYELEEISRFFGKVPAFQELSKDQIHKLSKKALITYFQAGTQLFLQGNTPLEGVYIILRGELELSYESSEEIRHDSLGRGDVYGALSILRNKGISLRSGQAKQDTFLYIIPSQDFIELCGKHHSVEQYFYNPLNKSVFERSYAEMRKRGKRHQEALMQVNIRDACKRPISFCSMNDSIQQAAKIMTQANFGYLLVNDNQQKTCGVLSDSDIRRALANDTELIKTPVSHIMTIPFYSISDRSTVLEALLCMESYGISHIPGLDNNGQISCVLTSLDLPQMRNGSPLDYIYRIRNCSSPAECREITKDLPKIISSLLSEGYSPINAVEYISRVNDAVLRMMVNIALQKMGAAPLSFDFIVLGSEGRMEQTLGGDQDNAIIYEDTDDENIHNWFKNFSSLICGYLDLAGYVYCNGRIMAENEAWCQPLSHWKKYFNNWVDQPSTQACLNGKIFFDFRSVYGDGSLAQELRKELFQLIKNNGTPIMAALSLDFAQQRPPLGLFGNFLLDKTSKKAGVLDIKRVMNFFVEFTRILSLENAISDASTQQRLEALHLKEVLNQEEFENLQRAWKLFMFLRLQHQIELHESNLEPDNFIKPNDLNSLDRNLLKRAFQLIPELQLKLKMRFCSGLS